MPRFNSNSTDKKTTSRKFKPVFFKKKCPLCQQGVLHVDYKNVELLKKFLSHSGKILPRRTTGCCNKHQRMVMIAIKRARYLGLIPYLVE
jgi:small subunit ribosomal protein S18